MQQDYAALVPRKEWKEKQLACLKDIRHYLSSPPRALIVHNGTQYPAGNLISISYTYIGYSRWSKEFGKLIRSYIRESLPEDFKCYPELSYYSGMTHEQLMETMDRAIILCEQTKEGKQSWQ